jgi:PKD repeat protein
MRGCVALIMVIGLGFIAMAQGDFYWAENLPIPGGPVAPGELVTAQEILIRRGKETAKFAEGYFGWGWTDPEKASGEPDYQCATTNQNGNSLWLTNFGFVIPNNAVIKGITAHIFATRAPGTEATLKVRLESGSNYTYDYVAMPPEGDCGAREIWLGDWEDLWGRQWSPGEINSLRVRLQAEFSSPGGEIRVDAVEIIVDYALPANLEYVVVRNTAPSYNALGEIERIEVVRDGTVIGSETSKTELAKFTTMDGVKINIGASYRKFTWETTIQIRVKVANSEPLPFGKSFALGDTRVTLDGWPCYVTYWWHPAAEFYVPSPSITFDQELAGGDIYAGQRFLAGRIIVDASELPFETTVTQVRVRNIADTSLPGQYISAIEVRRASDDALLGQASSSEIAKFATTTGTAITTSANNKILAYSSVSLEIWITLKSDAPPGRKIQLALTIVCGGKNFDTSAPESAVFTVSQGEPSGIDSEVIGPEPKGVVAGETFLAQRIKLTDSDDDPYDVILSSILVKNVAELLLADQHISKIEVKRKTDGAVLGSATNLSGLSTTGVRIGLTSNNVIPDDATVEIELWVTLADSAVPDREIKLDSQIWYSEGGAVLSTEPLEGPNFSVVRPEGLTVSNVPFSVSDHNVYPGQSFMAQRILLDDNNDYDPYGVTINRVFVKNLSTVSDPSKKLADEHVASIEVRDNTGKLLGQITNVSGLNSDVGVPVPVTQNNTIPDDKSLTIEIWITLKPAVPAGKKVLIGTRVEHTEGGQTFTKPSDFLPSGVEFTTATAGGRTVDFTYSPDKPKWSDEITFTPSVNPSTGIVYARWDFGDGTIVERKSAEGEKPLDPIKYKYGKGGEFTVVYAVRDEANRETRATKKVTVTNEPPKNLDFTFSPASPQVNQVVTFTPSDKIEDPDGDITKASFRWDFGDGSNPVTTTGRQNVTHTYTRTGTFTVVLTVTDQGGASTTVQKSVQVGEVTPPAPQPPTVTSLTADPAYPEAGKPVTFTATATAPAGDPVTKWKWNFGDGTPVQETTESTVTHTFQNPGTYTVSVQAQNSAGWSAARSIQIVVHPAGVEFGAIVLDNPVTGNQCRIQIFAPSGATDLKLTILDQAGRIVIRDKPVTLGTFIWDLKDTNGNAVPNGLYLFYVTAKIGGETKRTEIGRILVRR